MASHDYEKILKQLTSSANPEKQDKKIILIIPPSPQIPTPGREFLISGPFEGFTYVATLIKKLGFELEIIDCRRMQNIDYEILRRSSAADLIGIATYCDSFVFLQYATKLIKDTFPDKSIILGGPLVTSIPEIILENTRADYAIVGEGELTLIEFLTESILRNSNSNIANIQGLAFKDSSGKAILNPPRIQIKNLDNLPLLDYTIWPHYKEIVDNGQILISSTRGCPQRCSFCFKTLPKLRNKSLDRFEEEVAFLKKTTNFNYTWLNDLTFNVSEERAINIGLIMKKHGVKYHCFTRVQRFSKNLAKELKKTGCLGTWFGIESYDQQILSFNRKNTRIQEINEAMNNAREAKLSARGLFIVGLPGETEESLKNMIDFIEKGDFLPLAKYLTPFPGTETFNMALKSGKIKDIVDFLKTLSQRKVGDFDDELINLTQLDESILKKYFHKIWEITKKREPFFCD